MNKPISSKGPASVQFNLDPQAKGLQESGAHEPSKTPNDTVSQKQREADGRRFGDNLKKSFKNFRARTQQPKSTDNDHNSSTGAGQPSNAKGGDQVPGIANGILGQLSGMLKLPDYLLNQVQQEMMKWAPGAGGQAQQGAGAQQGYAPASGTASRDMNDGQNAETGAQRPWEKKAPDMVLGFANSYFSKLAKAGVPDKMLKEAYGLMMDHMPYGTKQASHPTQPLPNDTPKTSGHGQGPQNVTNSSGTQQDGFRSEPPNRTEPLKDPPAPVDPRTTTPGAHLLENRLRTAFGDVKAINSAADPGANHANLQDTLRAGFERMLNTPYIAESLEDDEKETIKKHVQNLSVSNPDPKHIDEARGFLGAMAQELARGVKESFEKVLEEEPDLNKRNEARQRLGDVLANLDDIAEGTSSHAANGSSGAGGTTEQNKVLQEIEKQTQMAKEVAATEEIFGLVQAFMSLTKKGREYSLQLI